MKWVRGQGKGRSMGIERGRRLLDLHRCACSVRVLGGGGIIRAPALTSALRSSILRTLRVCVCVCVFAACVCCVCLLCVCVSVCTHAHARCRVAVLLSFSFLFSHGQVWASMYTSDNTVVCVNACMDPPSASKRHVFGHPVCVCVCVCWFATHWPRPFASPLIHMHAFQLWRILLSLLHCFFLTTHNADDDNDRTKCATLRSTGRKRSQLLRATIARRMCGVSWMASKSQPLPATIG